MKECIIPPPALRDRDIGMYENHAAPEVVAWGIILSDVARHVANAMNERYRLNPEDALNKIRESFLFELDTPTADVRGGFEPSRH